MTTPDGPADFRLEYIGGFVQKSLKLKPEKWARLLLTEEYRNAVLDFVDNPLPAALFIALTPNAQLVASTSFPIPCQRTKGEYDNKNFPQYPPKAKSWKLFSIAIQVFTS